MTYTVSATEVKFYNPGYSIWSSYNPRYEIAYTGNNFNLRIKNSNGLFLSRICKTNGKHRYYVTQEICVWTNKEECRMNHRERVENEYYYKSKYIGKNLDSAISQLQECNFIFRE